MTRLDPSDELHRTAVHEAGHAVSEYIHRETVPWLSIVPNDERGTAGSAQSLEGPDGQSATETADYIVDCFAGFAAQVYFAPHSEKDGMEGRSTDDAIANKLLAWIPATERELRKRAGKLVEREWKAIEVVAIDLLRFDTLDETEVEMLIEIARGQETRESLERYRCLAGRHENHDHHR